MKLSKIAGVPASSLESTSEVQIMASRTPQAAGLPNAMPEDQPHVKDVADQPLGQRQQPSRRRRPVQDHQVDVDSLAGAASQASVSAVSHDRDVREQPLGTGLAEVLQGVV